VWDTTLHCFSLGARLGKKATWKERLERDNNWEEGEKARGIKQGLFLSSGSTGMEILGRVKGVGGRKYEFRTLIRGFHVTSKKMRKKRLKGRDKKGKMGWGG